MAPHADPNGRSTVGDVATQPQLNKQSLAFRRNALEERFVTWNPEPLGKFLETSSELFGDRPLVITDDRTLSYREVSSLADDLADGLYALGIRPGDHVAMLMANYIEFLPLKFAIAKVGAVAIPMNFLYRKEELAYVLAQSQCKALITMTGFSGLDYLNMLDEIVPGWSEGASHAGFPHLEHFVQLSTDGRTREGLRTVEALAELGRANSGATRGLSISPDSIGDILYTSGTTGAPKGVLVTHDAVLRTGYASALTRGFEDGRRILFSLPCYHMFGYVEGILAAMMAGGAVVPLTRFSPQGYLAGIEKHSVTDILCVPTMTVAILEYEQRGDYDISTLDAVLSGSAPAPAWLWDKVAKELGASEIVTGYGMTECGGAMTLTLPEDSSDIMASSVGQTKWAGAAGLPGGALTEYRTVDPITGSFMEPGEEGELVNRGPTNMLGYWDKPEETNAALRDGWLYSGDIGIVREDGYIEVTGRTKEMYKSGGELVMPKEIEELLSLHPDISQVYAIGIPDERWGEIGCVCIVRAPGATITKEEVLDICRDRLARFKVPKSVIFMDSEALPTTPTGKIQKFRLVKLAAEEIRSNS